ncbi:MAG TPA: pitrilysin family protein [Blastocatellia bacterium]|nr:pitrilysin family protein [Blastocatellia bacterium]
MLSTENVPTGVFPYRYFMDDLPNGLRAITVPTDFPNLVALYIVVRAGSRNEVEPGRSGFAHLFEHLMFRGTERFSSEKYDEVMKLAGADRNAYTTDDLTAYHVVFSKEDIETIMDLEADRFQNLDVPVELFKTETKAVLGEYNKNSSNPVNKLIEVLRDTAFESHPYKHTTMGFLRDIERMPEMYDYSKLFFRRYYRPEYTTLIVVGDVVHEEVASLVKKYWGYWTRGDYVPEIPQEPEQTSERVEHVAWPVPTLPWVVVSYKGPPYSDEQKDMPAMDLMGNLGFSKTSELYQRLVIKEQKVDLLFYSFDDRLDPYLLTAGARVKDIKDLDYVRREIVRTFESYKTALQDEQKLNAVKSHLRYSFSLGLDNSEAIAAVLAPYVALRQTPETINRLYEVYASITQDDIREMAAKYFVEHHRTTVTLSHDDHKSTR